MALVRVFLYAPIVAMLVVACEKEKGEDEPEEEPRITGTVTTTSQNNVSSDDGGGNDDPPPVQEDDEEEEEQVVPEHIVALTADCLGLDCGASGATTYSGSGIGVWKYENTSGIPQHVDVNLTGVNGRDMMLVVTNQASGPVNLPSYELSPASHIQRSSIMPGPSQPERPRIVPFTPPFEPELSLGDRLMRRQPSRSSMFPLPPPPPSLSIVGDTRNFYHTDETNRAATLKKIVTTTDGTTVQFWVETSEYDVAKITDAMIDTLAEKFADDTNAESVYTMVTALHGLPWGDHGYIDLIPDGQPIDIVLLNFNNDQQPFGTIGYFWALHNFVQEDDSQFENSNESLSFYLDTETLYEVDPSEMESSLKIEVSTLAHEFVHMINFFQRSVMLGNDLDGWMEEMSAMMMEDVVSLKLDQDYNTIRDDRMAGWLANKRYNCQLTAWGDDYEEPCFGYEVAGPFGGHLLRHYGIGFYQSMLTANTDPAEHVWLDDLLIAEGSSLKEEVRRWGASVALLPATGVPVGFGLPERIELGYTLPAIVKPEYDGWRELPASVPATLAPLGHFPMARTPSADSFSEFVEVPPGTALTVIVK
jgi:hypothetical protein